MEKSKENTVLGLPEGWRMKESKSRPGTLYYINKFTNEAVWEVPTVPAKDYVSSRKKSKKIKKIRCSHILVKHEKSRRPSSWRSKSITRTKEEAIKILKKHKKEIEENSDFAKKVAEIASSESDCSSAKRGGDLGVFGKGVMQKAFERVAFRLEIGELSDVVDSPSGVHLIFRSA